MRQFSISPPLKAYNKRFLSTITPNATLKYISPTAARGLNWKYWLFFTSSVGMTFWYMKVKSTYGQMTDRKLLTRGDQFHMPDNPSWLHYFGALAFSQISEDTVEEVKSRNPEFDLNVVGGYQEELHELADIVRYLQDPKCLEDRGLNAPKGVILSGPPGVGKTVLAEAVAGHAGVPIFMLSAPELESKYVGDTEKQIIKLFARAKNNAPCVVCIDEFDSIAGKRGGSNPRYHNSIVNQLLSTLSQNHPGVVVFATTNHYDALDPAVVRPGRFDRHISLSLPKLTDREKILAVLTKGKNLHSTVSFNVLARITEGFTGAKLNALVNEAGLAAFREGADAIHMRHFDQARTVLAIGRQRSNIPDPVLSKRVATHEIGHALVGVKLGLTLYKVALADAGDTHGYTEWLPRDHEHYLKSELLDQICMLLASRASEELSDTVSLGCEDDIKKAKEIAMRMSVEGMLETMSGITAERDIETVLVEQKNRAKKILKTHIKERLLLIEALAHHGELSRDDFYRIISENQLENPSEKRTAFGGFDLFGRPSLQSSLEAMPASRFAKLPKRNMRTTRQNNAPEDGGHAGINADDDYPHFVPRDTDADKNQYKLKPPYC